MVNLPFEYNLREELLSLLHNQHALFFSNYDLYSNIISFLPELSRKAEIHNVGRFGHENCRDLGNVWKWEDRGNWEHT